MCILTTQLLISKVEKGELYHEKTINCLRYIFSVGFKRST